MKIELQSLGKDGYHIFCDVIINGIHCRSLIDTGASKSVLSLGAISVLNLNTFVSEDENLVMSVNPASLPVDLAKIDSMSIGNFEIKDLIVAVMDMQHVNIHYQQLKVKPFDLILGSDILAIGQAVINYKSQTITLQNL